jgi:hypothetical protein
VEREGEQEGRERREEDALVGVERGRRMGEIRETDQV